MIDVPEAALKLSPELRSKLATALAGLQQPDRRRKFLIAIPGLKERAKTLIELVDAATFIFADRPLLLDARATALMTDEARALLAALAPALEAVEPWSVAETEQAVRACAEQRGAKLGSVAQPLRAALTGRTTSPSIFDVLMVLGKGESLARLWDQVHPEAIQR
jgi:glutamyl-tRNA synthetase